MQTNNGSKIAQMIYVKTINDLLNVLIFHQFEGNVKYCRYIAISD